MGTNLDKATVFAWLREQLAGPHLKVGANILYDLDFLHYEGVKVGGRFYDVLLADPLIYEYHTSYSLEAVASRRLAGAGKETSLLYQWCADAYGGKPNGAQRANIWRAPTSLVGPYAEGDAWLPPAIMKEQIPILRSMDQLEIAKLEMGLIPLLLRLRVQGVRIDLKRCEEIDAMLTGKIDAMYKTLDIQSVYAAADLVKLCDREGITYPKTDLGNPSFVKAWLLAHPHPALKQAAELRKLAKLRDTFIRGHLLGSHVNGRVHCEFHPLRSDSEGSGSFGAVSGRFSSSNPNLQQIPARDKYWAPILRSAFLPEEGELWNKDDLSQIEYRLGVHFGKGRGIEEVRRAYITDPKTDFYNLASALTGLDRQDAKSLSLGTLYGMGLDKFAEMIGKPLDEARIIFNTFNRKLPFMRDTYDYYGALC
jgi:DNA polymerase I-like protein with 3'-5' exonuclease and polymerase domains